MLTIMPVKACTKGLFIKALIGLCALGLGWIPEVHAEWKIKIDRESTDMRGNASRPFILESELPKTPSQTQPLRSRSEISTSPRSSQVQQTLPRLMPVQEVSVVMTENGFVPSKLYLRKGEVYQITIVNVSSAHRNSSFVIPSLSVYEGAYFGEAQIIEITADQEGLYKFLSPESGLRGEFVVYDSAPFDGSRVPASDGQ